MKKICLILTCFILILTLCACKSEDTAAFEKSDEYAKPFLESLVAKNNEDMAALEDAHTCDHDGHHCACGGHHHG